jgi:GntR family transcriptional regulator
VEALPDWASEALQLRPVAQGITLERLRRVDGELALYGVNHLPEQYAIVLPTIWRTSTASLYGTLRDRCGVEVATSSRILEAVSASRSLARLLEVAYRSPLIYIQSVARDATGKPIDCYRAWLRTDRLRVAVETDTWMSSTRRVVSLKNSSALAG